MKAFVELAMRLVIVCLCTVFSGCGTPKQPLDDGETLEIVSITDVGTEKVRGYPSAFGVILGETTDGSRILVAVPAVKQREVLASYAGLNEGQEIQLNLVPWAERPSIVDASYLANDFADEFDLRLYVELQ